MVALLANTVFVLLHIVQTRIWYDGTAQDVHEATSFGSVTLMLVFILMMENQLQKFSKTRIQRCIAPKRLVATNIVFMRRK